VCSSLLDGLEDCASCSIVPFHDQRCSVVWALRQLKSLATCSEGNRRQNKRG
jgi:hypothetical protein